MGSFYGEGKGEGVWVVFQGEKWWLSALSKEDFRNRKKLKFKAEFLIEKRGETHLVGIDEIKLAE
jgi:hypothetical protein